MKHRGRKKGGDSVKEKKQNRGDAEVVNVFWGKRGGNLLNRELDNLLSENTKKYLLAQHQEVQSGSIPLQSPFRGEIKSTGGFKRPGRAE